MDQIIWKYKLAPETINLAATKAVSEIQISELSKERIRLCSKGIKKNNPNFLGDIGFRVLKIDTSNMADVYYTPDNIKQADNPNVFVMCMLKHSDNTISRRQEVGRGLRLSVNQNGDRMDHPATVHEINILTVVASESYKDFVGNLQKEISEALSARPRKADVAYFTGKIIKTESGTLQVTPAMAKQIHRYLIKNDYTDDSAFCSLIRREASAIKCSGFC